MKCVLFIQFQSKPFARKHCMCVNDKGVAFGIDKNHGLFNEWMESVPLDGISSDDLTIHKTKSNLNVKTRQQNKSLAKNALTLTRQ